MSESASETLAPVEPLAVLPSTTPSEKAAVTAARPSDAASTPRPRRTDGASSASSSSSPSALARTDAFIAHLQRCMQTRAGADTVLMFACYATRLAGNLLDIGGRAALRSSARQLVAALFSLPPSTSVVLKPATMPRSIALVLDLAARLQAYSGMVSEMRTMGRLWGLLGLYSAVKGLIAARKQQKQTDALSDESAEKTFAALVAWAQTLCLVVFQVCENAAYLGSKKILPIKPLNQGRLAILSVRFWGAYVAMEVVKHLTERARRLSASGGVKATAAAAEEKRWQEDWRTAFYRNAAWAPLTMHWGTPGGLLPDVLVALFALYPATGGMRDLWRRTA
ncbi:peroxin 11C [Beauveria bassiana ARSEF 2860]|uniref:Peroxin 11C n=1 Tax=Beauveria bassiana (strain ARSEF 2860) TaxID=655819 RepID=J4WBL5_BEAB2|nr:peroxin 11C [Beauveria bassiana ARSEF 2860]EJP67500.1 peroxin 11C [Beauveria bassiana ARSEF 2860]